MYYSSPPPSATLPARALILSLMNSVGTGRQTIGHLIHAGALFGIEAATLRVAVARLLKEDLLESPERGIYLPGAKSRALKRQVEGWQTVASRISPWQGDWLVAITHHLGRRDRKQLRLRERALALFGYREAEASLWVRPANLSRACDDHRADLISLGADEDLLILRVSQTALPRPQDWPSLWSAADLERSYQQAISDMTTSQARLSQISAADGARESLLIGQAVIRAINFDPLLPPELGNHALFLDMVAAMKRYNQAGKRCWAIYHAEAGGTADTDAF